MISSGVTEDAQSDCVAAVSGATWLRERPRARMRVSGLANGNPGNRRTVETVEL